MSQFHPDEGAFSRLKDKVVVLTGGATGIGAATVERLHQYGAKVIFGDVASDPASALVSKLGEDDVTFVQCDVTKYSDLYNLFKVAHDKYGQIDHAASIAGIFEYGKWFDPDLTITTVGSSAGPTNVIDINVLGSANFARIAVVFLRHDNNSSSSSNTNKSLTFMSSVNAFRESPGLYMYQTSKHAIQGLMRSMRKPIYERDHIRINCVCPGVTETPMTEGIAEIFRDTEGMYCQQPEDVAKVVLGFMVNEWNGKAVYVEGGEGWEFEDGFYREMPRWLGEEPTRRMRANAEAVQKGALTRKKD